MKICNDYSGPYITSTTFYAHVPTAIATHLLAELLKSQKKHQAGIPAKGPCMCRGQKALNPKPLSNLYATPSQAPTEAHGNPKE